MGFGFACDFFHGLGLSLRHLDGEVCTDIFEYASEGREFSWGFCLTILCFDVVVAFS